MDSNFLIRRPRRHQLPRMRSYNQFSQHYKNIPAMTADLERIASMGFSSVWVNPFFDPCRSMDAIKKEITRVVEAAGLDKTHKRIYSKPGSPYATRSFDINPVLSAHKDEKISNEARHIKDYADIRAYTTEARELGMTPLFDFVMRHVAVDHALVQQKPHWFKRHENGNFKFFGRNENYRAHSQSWDDVLEFDYENPQTAREITEEYLKPMADIVIKEFGFGGLRIDAAGMIPTHVYEAIVPYLDEQCLQEHGEPAMLLGETLGQDVSEFMRIGGQMDYVYNSVYFYPFTKNFWLQDDTSLSYAKGMLQHHVAPTIGFVGNHDLPRVAEHYLNNKHIRGTVLQDTIKKSYDDKSIVSKVISLFESQNDKNIFRQEQLSDLAQTISNILPSSAVAPENLTQGQMKAWMASYPPDKTAEGKAIYNAITDALFKVIYQGAVVDEYGATYQHGHSGKAPISEMDMIRLLPANTDRCDIYSRVKEAMCFAAFASDGGWFFELGDEWGVTKRTSLFAASPEDLNQRALPDMDLSDFVSSINTTIAQMPGPARTEWVQRCYLSGKRDRELCTFLVHQGEGFTGTTHMIVANLSRTSQEVSLAEYRDLHTANGRNMSDEKKQPPDCLYLCGDLSLSPELKRELAVTNVRIHKSEKSLVSRKKPQSSAMPELAFAK